MKRTFTLAFLSMVAASLHAQAITRVNEILEPALGIATEASAGDTLLVSGGRQEVEFARLLSDARVSQSGMVLPKGLLLECDTAVVSGRKDYCKGHKAALYCLQDRDDDGRFDKVKIIGGGRPAEHLSASYEVVYMPDEDGDGWRKELVFQGAAGGVLRLTYREFGNEWTKPLVSRELSYDTSPSGPTEITYKGARISFSSVTSNSVKYSVISDFRASSSAP